MSLRSVLLGDGTFAVQVAGVASCQPELEEICGGEPLAGKERIVLAVLVPEADNPYSPEAVRVQIQRPTVGYLGPAAARALRAPLWTGKRSGSVATGVGRKSSTPGITEKAGKGSGACGSICASSAYWPSCSQARFSWS